MTAWLNLLNPFRVLATEREASTAARAGAVGAWLLGAGGLMGAVLIFADLNDMATRLRISMLKQYADPQIVATIDLIVTPETLRYMATLNVVLALILILLGVIQWHKRTKLMPLILFVIFALGLLFALDRAGASLPFTPAWRVALAWTNNAVSMLLLWTGFRGGSRLRKLAPT